MIKIRSITYNLNECFDFSTIEKSFEILEKNDFYIRTKRLNLPVNYTGDLDKINVLCDKYDIRWFCLSFNDLKNNISEILKNYKKAFVNIICIDQNNFDDLILKKSVKLLKKIGRESNGINNFRLGLSFNILPNGPFFPCTYSSGDSSFSIALELTQLFSKIVKEEKGKSLAVIRKKILEAIIPEIDRINKVAIDIEKNTKLKFAGFDFSLAPILEENGSVLEILNELGLKKFGQNGTLFFTYYLTNILKYLCTKYRNVGFSGVMYSVLEDEILAKEKIKVEDLIKASAMCGCGIDMVPIKDSTSDKKIIAAMMDLAAISLKYNKPLGVRFIPVSDKKTSFKTDGDFIINAQTLKLSNSEKIDLKNFKILE